MHNSNCCEITGNDCDAKNKDLLIKEGITHIINVTTDIPFYHEKSKHIKIEYLRVPVDDEYGVDLKKYFEETNEFIDKAKRKNGKVLVHCDTGISRSPTIVLAYLFKIDKNGTPGKACEKLLLVRPIVYPRNSYLEQLAVYYNQLNEKEEVDSQSRDGWLTKIRKWM